MRKYVIVWILVGSIGCAGGGSSPCDEQDTEPNDSPGDAIRVGAQGTFVGCTAKDDDALDVYEIEAPSYGAFHFDFTPKGGETWLLLNDGTASIGLVEGGPDEPIEGWFGAEEGRVWYFEVTAPTGITRPFGYELAFDYLTIDDGYEPNNSKDEALAIWPGLTVSTYMIGEPDIFSSGLDDWFVVTLPAGTSTFRLLSAPTNVTLSFETYLDFSNPGSENGFGRGAATGPGRLFDADIEVSSDGEVYFHVFGDAGTGGFGDLPDNFATRYEFQVVGGF